MTLPFSSTPASSRASSAWYARSSATRSGVTALSRTDAAGVARPSECSEDEASEAARAAAAGGGALDPFAGEEVDEASWALMLCASVICIRQVVSS